MTDFLETEFVCFDSLKCISRAQMKECKTIFQWLAWCPTCYRALPESSMTQFNDTNIRHKASVIQSDLNIEWYHWFALISHLVQFYPAWAWRMGLPRLTESQTYRWFSAILHYLQCVSNSDTAVLHYAIVMFHVLYLRWLQWLVVLDRVV